MKPKTMLLLLMALFPSFVFTLQTSEEDTVAQVHALLGELKSERAERAKNRAMATRLAAFVDMQPQLAGLIALVESNPRFTSAQKRHATRAARLTHRSPTSYYIKAINTLEALLRSCQN